MQLNDKTFKIGILRRRRRFWVNFFQTSSAFGDPLDLSDHPLLLDIFSLGPTQLRTGLGFSFSFKVSFERHPNVHGKIYPNSFQFRLWFCSLSTFFWETLYLYLHLKFPWGRDLGSGGAQVCKLLATISICKCTYNYLYLYFKIPRGRACSHKGEPKSAKLSVHTDNGYLSGFTVHFSQICF